MKRIASLLLSLVLLMSVFGVNTYAASDTSKTEIHIQTVSQWNKLAKECELNTYSNNLIVYLDNDISFEGEEFNPLPYFNGTFDGQNHMLTDIVYEPDSINNGVIRLTCPKSVIRNVSVTYTINASADHIGFVGYNEGTLTNINVNGTLNGQSMTGLICGFNAITGKITDCESEGEVVGKNYTGGIAGTNYGTITGCKNRAHVNITVDDDSIDIKSITLETIEKSENAATVTDTGGIVGTSFGTISSCSNYSTIGYEHVGYNVGGIAGSQSGFMENCYNYGEVYGRKEVGGIIGQAEPSLTIVFATSYLEILKSDVNKIKDVCDDMNEDINDFSDATLNGIRDINTQLSQIQLALKELTGSDTRGQYVKALSIEGEEVSDLNISGGLTDDGWKLMESMANAYGEALRVSGSMVNENKDEAEEIRDELDELNELLNDFGNTAIDGIDYYTSDRDLYKDVSEKDIDSNTNGKIRSCYNYSYVEGDINIGGITGAMAQENNLDPEDDFDISGTATENFTYEMRCVVDKCRNEGRVQASKNYAGGIVGNETVGLIKNSINYGIIDSEDADYVGGIVGYSLANVNSNYAKCFISGDNYVGGIAGCGTKANGNGSFAQIREAETNVGSIFGNYSKIESTLVEDSSDIKNNWYVYDDLSGIDGISYDKMAYRVSDEEMLEMKIDENLKKVNVYFINDGTVIKKFTLEYGESLDPSNVPDNIDTDDDYGYWEGYSDSKLQNITKDLLFENEYENIRPSISTGEDVAYAVLEGYFSTGDSVKFESLGEGEGPLKSYEGIAYQLNYSLAETSVINRLRLYGFGYDTYDVYVKENGEWNKVAYEADGSYAVIDYADDYEAYAIVKRETSANFVLIGVAVGAVCIAVFAFAIKKKKSKEEKE